MVLVNGFLNQFLIDISQYPMLFNYFDARVICGGMLNDTRPTTSTNLVPPYPLTWTLAVTSHLLFTPSLTNSFLDLAWQLKNRQRQHHHQLILVDPPCSPISLFSPNLRSKHVCNWSSLAIIWGKRVRFRACLVHLPMVTAAYLVN